MISSKIKTARKAVDAVFRMQKDIATIKGALTRVTHPVLLNDTKRTTPISTDFGFSRGTPIDRYYIEKFLVGHKDAISGRLLEVADDGYTKRLGADGSSTCVLQFSKDGNGGKTATNGGGGTLCADLTRLDSFEHDAFDCFVCTQTFNFIYDFKQAIVGANALLKSGGTLLATVSAASQISRYDMVRWGDYWRFTDMSAKMVFEEAFGAGNVSVEIFGNALSCTMELQGCAVEDLESTDALDPVDEDYQLILGIVAKKR